MCALFGWLDCGKVLPIRLLKKLTQALANAAEERGTDASGISYIKDDNQVTIYKRPKPAHKIKFRIPHDTGAVMGHTRYATQGDAEINSNNHPFYGHADVDFAFAHNGVIHNYQSLHTSEQLPEPKIETDSYVAVQLLEKSGKLNMDSLKSMAEKIRGSFVFTALDQNQTLYFVKGSNPLCLLYFEQFGLYVYASTESIMKTALKRVGLHKEISIKIKVVEGEIISIDRNGVLNRDKFSLYDDFFYFQKSNTYYDYEKYDITAYTEYEQLVINYCSHFGIDKSDVMILLDYGYTANEIEEFLTDTDLFYEALKIALGEDDDPDQMGFDLCDICGW